MVTSKQVTIQMVRKFAENVEIVKFSKIEGNHSTEKVRKYCNESKIEHFDAAGPSDRGGLGLGTSSVNGAALVFLYS